MNNSNLLGQTEGVAAVGSGDLLGGWLPVEKSKPETYLSVIVCGILEYEEWIDTHEGFWCGRNWWSVRSSETDPMSKRLIKNITHWMRRPNPPNGES